MAFLKNSNFNRETGAGGFVRLAKLIQDHTFNQDYLLKTIASKQKLLE